VPPLQPPIADYALLADGRTAALVSRTGGVDWWCPPRFDAPSVFGALLDPAAGSCTVEGEELRPASRRYLDDTLVLETELEGAGGAVRLLDCAPPRPPEGAAEHDRALLRVLEGVRGTLTLRVRVRPRFAYGARTRVPRRLDGGAWRLEAEAEALLCAGDLPLEDDGDGGLVAELTLRAGERARLWLAHRPGADGDEAPRVPTAEALDGALEATIGAWRDWSSRLRPEGGDAAGVRRSAAVLKALIFDPTGAMVAAPTTSLPESLDGGDHRTWDYRYAWLSSAIPRRRPRSARSSRPPAGRRSTGSR
jgi:GH15 family glucan-1,4-alpha-glucosidase